jgi:Family of unknown function (DUF6029)
MVTMRIALTALLGSAVLILVAQEPASTQQPLTQPLVVHGNFSMDGQYYNEDSTIGAVVPAQKFALNSWGNVIMQYGKFSAGIRFEAYEPALVGYPAGQPYRGSGIGYRYVQFSESDLDVTVGNFYEQFGQGLVFRSYEERYLGVDNAMEGVKVRYRPAPGVYLKGVIGQQRFGFDSGPTKGEGIVRGVDMEVSLSECFPKALSGWSTTGRNLLLGLSFASKYQADKDPLLVLPENVGTWALRGNYTTPHWNLYADYAHKINDPNGSNRMLFADGRARPIYKDGQALLLNATYSTKGLGISAGTHAFDNMVFRSDRGAPTLFDLNINFLPALAKQHTYNLPATLYPYATQPNGEVAYQAEVFYKLKKGSKLGGTYGTKVAVNWSGAWGLDSLGLPNDTVRLRGYKTNFLVPGDRQFLSDLNVDVRRRLNDKWELAVTFMDLVYDIEVVQGKTDAPVVHADLLVVEGAYQFSGRNSVRFEVQHLATRQDLGNWATALAEFTFSPHWFVAAMDQYNYVTTGSTFRAKGLPTEPERLHYPIGSVGYVKGGNRFSMSYGRQRAGIFCVGGVCRVVPASNGLSLSITSTF